MRCLPFQGPVNHNNGIKDGVANTITQAMRERDYLAMPLQDHKLSLLQRLALDGDSIRESTPQLFEASLKQKRDGSPLKLHARRLLGQLVYNGLRTTDDNKLSLPSFPHYKPFQIVLVPETRVSRTTVASHTRKTY